MEKETEEHMSHEQADFKQILHNILGPIAEKGNEKIIK